MSQKKNKLKKHNAAGQKGAARRPDFINSRQEAPGKKNFLHFLLQNRTNQRLLLGGIVINILLFALYKYLLPMPDFFSDSNGYVLAAAKDLDLYYRPSGYPYFLQFLHNFSGSALFTIAVQYFLLVLSALFCFFSIDFLFTFSSKKIKLLSWLLLTINPVLLVLANQIASDSIFSAFTVIWFTLLLWVFKKGSWWALLLQLVFLYWAFLVRYNALYYPLVACIVFLISQRKSPLYKVVGIGATLFIIMSTYKHIKNITEEKTNAPVFAGFSGWQMANNALFLYHHIDVKTADFDDPQLQLLNEYSKAFIDSIPQEELAVIKKGGLTTSIFLWDPGSPLKQYLFGYVRQYHIPYFAAWYQVSETFGAFGKQIILDHPAAFFRYFIINNLGYFFMPDREFMKQYNVNTGIPQDTKEWFRFRRDRLYARSPGIQKSIVSVYPAIHAVLVSFCLIIPLLFLIRNRRKRKKWEKWYTLPVLFWYAFFLTNMGFSILASIVTLRYEVVWFILGFILPLWFLDQVVAERKRQKTA